VKLAAEHPFGVLLGLAVLLAGLLNAGLRYEQDRIGIPVPLLVYRVEAVSGTHHASILNLGIAPIGVVPVPTPIDIDGDLLPDVTVALNLVDLAGLLDHPLGLSVIAPNLEINRLLPGIPLTSAGAPLKINADITILDVGGASPPLHLRLGYDTGAGGAIPPKFRLLADGLSDFFNPVKAHVSAPGYEGPLSVIAGVEQGAMRADADLRFLPLPEDLVFSYGSDDAGQHIGVDHAGASTLTHAPADEEVDLQAGVKVTDGGGTSTISARVDRLPSNVDVTVLPGSDAGGGFDYAASTGGRAPDVRVDVADHPASGQPLLARLDLESLPGALHTSWNLPEDGQTEVHLSTPADPIGAVQARVANFDGDPTLLPDYRPGAPQHLDLRQSADGTQRLVTGRVQAVRTVDLVQQELGLDAHVQAGGGGALEVNAALGAVGGEADQVVAKSTVDPLPTDITAVVRDAGPDQAEDPLEITYSSSQETDVTGRVEVRGADLAPAAACGTPGTMCADLSLTDLPSTIQTKVAKLVGDDDHADTRVTVHAVPRAGSPAPSITAGLVSADADGTVLNADLGVTALPEDLGVRLVRTADGSLQRADFEACRAAIDDPTGTCTAGTQGSIGALDVDVRSYLDGHRPAALAPAVLDRPEHVVVVGAGGQHGTSFQALGRFTDIREVRYLADPTTALRVAAGAGQELLAEVHLTDIDPAPDDDDADSGQVFDLDATLGVPALPPSLDMCIRPEDAAATGDVLTTRCDDDTPFGDDVVTEHSPLSFGYVAGAPFDVTGSVHRREQGRTSLTAADAVADDTNVDARLDVTGLPDDLVLHLLPPTTPDPDSPDAAAGPLRARFEASASPTSIAFSGDQRKGDAICKDRRPGAEATCLSGTLEHLPKLLDLYVDPAAETAGPAVIGEDGNNITFHTDGGDQAAITGLDLSVVTPAKVDEGDPPRSDALLVSGSLSGIPEDVAGKLRQPHPDIEDDEPDLDVVAQPSLGTLDLDLRTSLDPDTFAAVPPAHLTQPQPFGQEITVQGEGDDVKAHLHTTDLTHVAYRSVRDADDRPLPTKVIALEFDGAQTARLYADLQKEGDGGGVDRLTADVVAPHLPSGLEVCFRGEEAAGTPDPAPGDGTWCDSVAPAQGAVQVLGSDGTDPTTSVDAYVRSEANGGSDLLSARIGATGVPPVLRATLPGGDDSGVDVSGFATDGTTAQGIGQLNVEAVLGGDLTHSGWTPAQSPFRDRPLPSIANGYSTPFPVVVPSGQHVSLGQDGDRLQLDAQIGPGSSLQHLSMTNAACAAPANDPPDYPYYPTGDDSIDYRCIGGTFSPSAAGDPLAINIAKGTGPDQILRLRDAGLSDVPDWFQMTLADAPATRGDHDELRPRCGLATDGSQPDGCLPPLIRFDQPSPTAQLFGLLDQGDPLASFVGAVYTPTCPAGVSVCGPDFDHVPAVDDPGIRVKVLDIKPHPDLPSVPLLRAALRLTVPQSLTIQSPQTWAFEDTDDSGQTESAKDIRFAYVVHDAQAHPVESLGRFAAFVNDGGQEILVSDPNDVTKGLPLPGELDLGLYLRDSGVQGRKFLQVDGRTTQTLDAQLSLFDGNLRPSDLEDSVYSDVAGLERTTLRLVDAPKAAPGDPLDQPSFRIRFEMLKAPGDPGASSNVSGPPSALQLLGDLTATLDFDPDGTPARRIEGVMSIDGPLVGLEVVAFDDVDKPPSHADNPPGGTRVPAEFSMDGSLTFEKLNYQLDDFNADTYIHIQSKLSLDLHVTDAQRFMLRNNVASFNAVVDGPSSSARVGPIHWNIDKFNVEVDTGYWIQAEVTYDGNDSDVHAQFSNCRNGAYVSNTGRTMPQGIELDASHGRQFNGSVDLLDDSRFDTNVVGLPDFILVPIVEFFSDVDPRTAARDGTCNLQPGDYDLIHHADPFAKVLHPGDPLAIPGHDVPPANPSYISVPPAGAERVIPGADAAPLPVNAEITDPVSLCGLHAFDELKIDPLVVVKVASTADDTPVPYGDGHRPRCPAGSEGTLRIVAKTVINNGFIDANAVMAQPPAGITMVRGNGGGGHGGTGGFAGCDVDFDACSGFGHVAYSAFPADSPLTEPGMPGSNGFPAGDDPVPAGGYGGGQIVVAAGTITNNGVLTAVGGVGQDGCPGDDYTHAGGGGGSGGGISLIASTIDNAGMITVRGGQGGPGWFGGGGGGAGVVKIHTPELLGGDPIATGGLQGAACGSDMVGSSGQDLDLSTTVKVAPAAVITSVADDSGAHPLGWVGDLTRARFGYTVKLPDDPPTTGDDRVVAFLCLVPRNDLSFQFQMPQSDDDESDACGKDLARGGVVITSRVQSASSVDGILINSHPDGIPLEEHALTNGIWGAWIQVCRVHNDDGDRTFDCHGYDPIPPEPDYVFGADASNPTPVVDAPGLPTRLLYGSQTWYYAKANPTSFPGEVRYYLPGVARPTIVKTTADVSPAFSSTDAPIERVLCWSGTRDTNPHELPDSAFTPCNVGVNNRYLPNGENWASARIHLANGGVVQTEIPIVVDAGIPVAQAEVTARPPLGSDGWHRATPAITISIGEALDQNNDTFEHESGFDGAVLAYSVDGGAERQVDLAHCTADHPFEWRFGCAIPQSEIDQLGPGVHHLRYTAIDMVGNRRNVLPKDLALLHPELDEYSVTFRLDPEEPAAELTTVPAAPDGLAGWFTTDPTLVLRDKDRVGGSGIGSRRLTIGATTADYTGPVTLTGPGPFSWCASVTDVAGNPAAGGCGGAKVDLADPTVSLSAPPVPGGGWYRGPVAVTIAAADGGSGVPGFVSGGAAADCRTTPAPAAPAGRCASVDGGPFVPSDGTLVLGEGVHVVRAFATDRAGRRSAVAESVIRIDSVAPVVAARLTPPLPARGPWWRRVPLLSLRASEAGSGTASIAYRLDGGAWTTYRGPVDLPVGVHVVRSRATDAAGNVGAESVTTFQVDATPPTVAAQSPSPLVWTRLLGPSKATLRWTAADDQAGPVRVTVIVYNLLGQPIRHLDGGTVTVPAGGGTVSGTTLWDGRNETGQTVNGLFHYRVVLADGAGNRAQSGESRPLQVAIGLL
jgi:hypothetical protein